MLIKLFGTTKEINKQWLKKKNKSFSYKFNKDANSKISKTI
jgi:hypothetical protein